MSFNDRSETYGSTRYKPTPFVWLFLGKALLLLVTIIVVWALYASLLAYRLQWLGLAYEHLQPLTLALYGLVEILFSGETRYKIRGAITDELGQRSLFLLLMTATVELSLYSLFKLAKSLVSLARR